MRDFTCLLNLHCLFAFSGTSDNIELTLRCDDNPDKVDCKVADLTLQSDSADTKSKWTGDALKTCKDFGCHSRYLTMTIGVGTDALKLSWVE